jgi:serine kinase of HPr protein (carbohydrate metabolism regulator)
VTTDTPLILSPKHCSAVIDLLRIYLSARLADTVNLHGVFMDVLGMGVLITGDSGVGKSELALELISRGHGLVADDFRGFLRQREIAFNAKNITQIFATFCSKQRPAG